MILHAHKDKTDVLQLNSVANEFVSRNSSRIEIFEYKYTVQQNGGLLLDRVNLKK